MRLLLVEFAVEGTFQRAPVFPFLKGAVQAAGGEARWVRFGVPPGLRLGSASAGAGLDPGDVEVLRARLREFRPDRVLFGGRPGDGLLAALAADLAGVRVQWLAEGARGQAGPEVAGGIPLEALEDPADALPLPGPGGSLARLLACPADHAFEAGNARAAAMDTVPFVLAGEECTYDRPFAANPFFAEGDLAGCPRDGGCAFCVRPPRAGTLPGTPVDRMRRQVEAVARTCPFHGRRPLLRFLGEPALHQVEALAEVLAGSGLPPADAVLDGRADALVARDAALRRALARLAGTGHRLEIGLVGIENFCSAELARLNKGLTGAQVLAAVAGLLELERDFPEGFGFRRHGGLSVIPLTPWTRPWELDLNLAAFETLGLEGLSGKATSGRLRLYPGLPLHGRAARDGLLVPAYADPLLDTSRLNLYADEAPWRFADPVMEPLGRLLVRLGNDRVPPGFDPLASAVEALARASAARGIGTLALARHFVAAAMEASASGGVPAPGELLEAASRRLEGQGPREGRPDVGPAPDLREALESPDVGSLPLDRLLALKPVTKIEPVRAEDVPAWTGRADLPCVRARPAAAAAGAGEPWWEVFFGADPARVAEAMAVSARLDACRDDPEARARADADLGTLLGYPRCCAEAFAREPAPLRENYFWAIVARRVADPGPVPFEANPGGFLKHVPCGCGCGPSVERVRAFLDGLDYADGWSRARLVEALRQPLLILDRRRTTLARLEPLDPPGERFRYRVGMTNGSPGDLAPVLAADEIRLEGECTLLLRAGRPVASLSGEAFLWWSERAFQADFWQGMVRVRRLSRPAPGPGATAAARPAPRDPAGDAPAAADPATTARQAAARGLLAALLDHARREGTPLAGHRVAAVEPGERGEVAVRLARDGEAVPLILEAGGKDRPALFRVGPWRAYHPEGRPPATPGQWAAVRALQDLLDRGLRQAAALRRGRAR